MRKGLAEPVPDGFEHYSLSLLRHSLSGRTYTHQEAWAFDRARTHQAQRQVPVQQPQGEFSLYIPDPASPANFTRTVAVQQRQGQELFTELTSTMDMGRPQHMSYPLGQQLQQPAAAAAGIFPTNANLSIGNMDMLDIWRANVEATAAAGDQVPVMDDHFDLDPFNLDPFALGPFASAPFGPAPISGSEPATAQAQGTQESVANDDVDAEGDDDDADTGLAPSVLVLAASAQAQGTAAPPNSTPGSDSQLPLGKDELAGPMFMLW
jgi:hypothetical protein